MLSQEVSEEAIKHTLTIKLLGAFDCRIGGQRLGRLRSRKGRLLLALLVLKGQRELDRSWIAATLWPDSPPDRALFYLRRELSLLRQALGPESPRIQSPSRDTVRFDAEGAEIDVVEFDEIADPELYRGPLLEGIEDDWVQLERARFEQAFIVRLQTLAELALEQRNPEKAIPLLRRAIAHEPLRESLHRSLFTALGDIGDYGALAKEYRNLRKLLKNELGVEPSQETSELIRRIRLDARTRTADEASSHFENGHLQPARLPNLTVELIGREEDTKAVIELFENCRAVTLTGSGGIGKTSLAIRVASELEWEVVFVALAAVSSESAIAAKVIEALGLRQRSRQTPLAQLIESIRAKNLLLVLDNCEQISTGCSQLIEEVLRACPLVKVLATSRHAIVFPGAFNWRVPSLSAPAPEDQRKSDLEALLEFPAVRCFVERANMAGARLKLDRQNAAAISSICSRLDGIPLALGLAAARTTSMSIEQIESKLDDRFHLLGSKHVGEAPRQATLLATIEWSTNLLSAEESLLFKRLAIFERGWGLEAAEEVCSDSSLDQREIADLLARLVGKSLVVFEATLGQGRYRFLETLREYARNLLAQSGESEGFKRRHLSYFFQFAEEHAPLLYDQNAAVYIKLVEVEHENLNVAQAFCLQLPLDVEVCEGTSAACASLRFAGWLMRMQFVRGFFLEARTQALAAIERAKSIEADEDFAMAYISAAICANFQGDLSEAKQLFEQALLLGRRSGRSSISARALQNLGWVVQRQGDFKAAKACILEALSINRANKNPTWQAINLNNLGIIALALGDWIEARDYLAEALPLTRVKGCALIEGFVLAHLGVTAMRLDEYEIARRYFGQSIATLRGLDDRFHLATAFMWLGRLEVLEKRFAEARTHFEDAMNQFVELGSELELAQCLESFALLAGAQDHCDRATTLLAAASVLRSQLGAPLTPTEERDVSELKTRISLALSARQFDSLWSEGALMRVQDAVDLSLSDLPIVPVDHPSNFARRHVRSSSEV